MTSPRFQISPSKLMEFHWCIVNRRGCLCYSARFCHQFDDLWELHYYTMSGSKLSFKQLLYRLQRRKRFKSIEKSARFLKFSSQIPREAQKIPWKRDFCKKMIIILVDMLNSTKILENRWKRELRSVHSVLQDSELENMSWKSETLSPPSFLLPFFLLLALPPSPFSFPLRPPLLLSFPFLKTELIQWITRSSVRPGVPLPN